MPATAPKTSWSDITGYSLGQAAMSVSMNGIYAYAMLYYTQAVGMPFVQVGVAFALASLWDAVVDPAIGHLSDNTRCRWGRRHPYMLVGGFLMAVSFYFIWAIPGFVIHRGHLFAYVVILNLLFRTAFGLFTVPYVALGFEVCGDYNQRSDLQGASIAMAMLANILGPALGWTLFFHDRAKGTGEATSVAANFIHMGTAFSVAVAVLTVAVVAATWRYAFDSRSLVTRSGNSLRAFWRDSREIVIDRRFLPIVGFFCVGLTGALFVATNQMYLYVYFMHLGSVEKSIVHGGTMVLCGAGALLAAPLGRRLDKKQAVCIGAAVAGSADLLAGVIFVGGMLKPDTAWMIAGHRFPVAIIVFGGCDMLNWLGVGLYQAVAMSMLADVSEANELASGVRKDGGYSAIFSFAYKLVISAATLIASECLAWVGFVNGSDIQTTQAVRWLLVLNFGIGALFAFLVIPIVLRYPVTRAFMADVKARLATLKAEGALAPEPISP